MSYTNKDILNQLSQFLTIIPQQYVDALLTLHDKLGDKKTKWVVSGNLSECLRTVKVEPDCIEIVTSKEDAEKICQAIGESDPTQIVYQTQQLPRNAWIGEKEYPVYIRSYYFEFNIDKVNVKVHGDLQFKVGSWDWGDTFIFNPDYVYVTGKKTAVVPLLVKYELYQSLGWADRAEKVRIAIKNRSPKVPLFSRQA